MDTPILLTLIITLVAAALLISEKLRPDLVAVAVMVTLGLLGLVTPAETFAGFSGSAVMTILGISIISVALHQTGITHLLGRVMSRLSGGSDLRQILVTMVIAAALSLFMNNIAAVGVLLPAVMSLTRQSQTSPSRLMMPLAYGTILGGMATLLTTSNIIVSGALRDAGFQPFGLLDFMPIGGPIVLVGIAYMLIVGRRMLPTALPDGAASRARQLRKELGHLYELDTNLCEVEVLPGSALAGKTIAAGKWAARTGLNLTALVRQGQIIHSLHPGEIIRTGDRLIGNGCPPAEELTALGLRQLDRPTQERAFTDQGTILGELVLSPHSNLIGRSLKEVSFRDKYNLNVLSVWRESKPIQDKISDLPLRFGDALLVQGTASDLHLVRQDNNLILLEEDPDAVLKPGKQALAAVITLLTLGLASLGSLPVATVVMAGAVLLLLTGCLEMRDIYQSMEWKAIFLIAGMWPLSTAIRTTGLADLTVQTIFTAVGQASPLLVAAVMIFLAFILTQVMSGQVASLVLAPLALAAASQLNVDPRGMGMGIALACSLAFATPFGHPVNIMVMNSGGYRIRDYLRIGFPLTVLAYACILLGLWYFWGIS